MRLHLYFLLSVLILSSCVSTQAAPITTPASNQTPTESPQTNLQPTPTTSIQVYFPRNGDQVPDKLINLYNSAHQSLDIAIYSLTYPSIIKAIGDAYRRGVTVRVITDSTEAKNKSQQVAIDDLLTVGVPVKINTHSGFMHIKMSIIDKNTTTTGSYNYSAAATNENDEMFVVVTDPTFVAKCVTEFSRMWTMSGFANATLSYSKPDTITPQPPSNNSSINYIGNKNTHIFHYATCSSVQEMNPSNEIMFNSREEAISQGYRPCKKCDP